MKKKILIVLLCVAGLFAAGVFGFGFFMTRGLEQLQSEPIARVNLGLVADGTYDGRYAQGRFSNEVRVTVKDARITDIELLDSVLFERPEITKELFARIIENNDTAVDAVTGATVTCKAYQTAIENALSN